MRNNNSGFTLLEILIAVFIFSIVSVMMMSALHTVFNSQSVTSKHAAMLSRLQLTLLLMSHDLEQTINRPITNAKGIVEGPLVGTPDSVTFTHAGLANPLGSMQRSTLQRTEYSLNKKEQLIRSTWPVLDQTQKTLPNQRILLHAITELHFEYLNTEGKFEYNWPPANKKQGVFPRAVRVTITLKNAGTLSQVYLIPGQTEKPPAPQQTQGSPSQPSSGQPSGTPFMPQLQGQPSNAQLQ